MKNLLLICFILISGAMNAQEQGGMRGTVVDKSTKQPLPGVNVIVLNTDIGASTGIDGEFLIKGIPEDVYRLKISYIGFQTTYVTDVRVVRDKITQVRETELVYSVIESEEVTVDASKSIIDLDATVTNFIYNREEIRRSPGAGGDVMRAIEILPGVSSAGGEFTAFSVRGGSPKDNIILVDNIPTDRIAHFEGGSEDQFDLGGRFSIFTPGIIDEAGFLPGGFNAAFGGKSASLIQLKIKEGDRNNSTVNGTYDIIGWEFNFDGPSKIIPNTSFLFSARHQDFKNILNLTGQKELGHPSFTDVILKTTSYISKEHKLSLLGIFSPERFIRNIDNVFESENLYETELTDLNEIKYLFGGNWRFLTSNSSFLNTTFYFRQMERDAKVGRAYTDPQNGITPNKERTPQRFNLYIDEGEKEYGVKTAFSLNISPVWKLNLGAEYSNLGVRIDRYAEGVDTFYTFSPSDFRSDTSKKYVVIGPEQYNYNASPSANYLVNYLELTHNLAYNFIINGGLRHEYNGFSETNNFSPRASLAYLFSDKLKLNAAFGFYYQNPDPRIITFNPQNLSLEPEKSIHYILGLTAYLANDLKFTAETYYKDYSNLIVRQDRASTLRKNLGEGWAAGIDFGLVKKLTDKWYGQINYSFAGSQRKDGSTAAYYNADFNIPHTFNLLFGYEFNKEWAIAFKWKYSTGRPKDSYIVYSDIFNDPNFVRYSKEITGNNDLRLDDLHTLNIRIDYRKQIGMFALLAFLDITNIYNRTNVNEERFLERNGGISKKGFGILPTMGIKLEF